MKGNAVRKVSMVQFGMLSRSKMLIFRVLFLAICFSLYSFWAFNLPTTLAPDEPMRMMVPNFIVQNGCLPLGDDPAIINSTWGSSYGFSAYGSSLFAVPFMLIANIIDGSALFLLLAARFANIVLSIATLTCCFFISDRLHLPYAYSFFYVGLVAFLPQYVFLSSYFNSDILEFLSTGLVVYSLIYGYQSVWSYRSCVYLGLSLGVLALSNYYAYGSIIASIVFYFGTSVNFVKNDDTLSKKRMLIGKPMLIFVTALAVGGWFFLRNAALYDGDIFGLSASSITAERLAPPDFKPSLRVTPKSQGMSPLDMLQEGFVGINWIQSTINSAIGVFGPMQFPLSPKVLLVYKAFFLLGFVSGVIYIFTVKVKKSRLVVFITGLIILVTPVLLSVYYSWGSDYQAQGRYIMAGIVLFMLIVAYGYFGIIKLISDAVCRACCFDDSSIESSRQVTVVLRCRQRLFSLLAICILVLYALLFAKSFVDIALPNCMGSPSNEVLEAVLFQ